MAENIVAASASNYVWRDFNGTVPVDAFAVGNCEGRLCYVGTAFFHDVKWVLPAILYENDPIARSSSLDKKRESNQVVKILCTPPGSTKIKWVPINKSQISKPPAGVQYLYMGQEYSRKVAIGRIVKDNGNTYLGKIWDQLEIVTSGGKIQYYSDFEILSIVQ